MNTIKKIFIVFCLSSLPSSLTLITLIGSLVYTDTAEASVTKMFGQANALFRAGKYPAAAKRLRVIIKKYPTFQPSYLLMGRIYYRLGNIRRAAKYFQKAPIGLLSGDAAYEYGIAMYETNRFNKAIKAFGKLSSKSKYRDLAYFYRGASYMKVSQWQRAVGQLQLAKKLPGHLTSARRKLLQTAQGRARAERQGKITRNTYVVVPRPQPLASPYYGAPDPAAPKPKNAPLPPPPPPPATAGFTNSITPSLAINSTTENNQFHGFKDSENKSSSQTFKISDTARYDLSPMKHGGQGYVQARIDFFQANSSSSGNSVRYIQDPNDPGVLKEEASDAGSGSVTKIGWVVAPEAGYPATASMDITVGFTASETTADGDAATAESSMGPTGNLSFSTDAFDMSVGFSMIDISVGGEPVKTSTKFEGEISKSLESGMQLTGNASQTTIEGAAAPQNPAAIMVFGGSVAKSLDSLSLSASGSQTAYTPGEGTLFVPGAQSKNSLVFTASTTFDFGASLSGSFTYNTLAEYTKSVVNEVGEPNEDGEKPSLIVLAEGEEQIMSGTFKITPFEFFYAQATYAQTARAFASVTPPAMQIFFEASEPDLISKFVVEVGVSKSF